MQKAAGGAYNALADETQAHVEGLVEEVSTSIVTGTGTAEDIEGILTQAGASPATADDLNHGTANALWDVSGDTDPSLDLDMIDELLDRTKGEADILLIGSDVIRRRINSLLRANQRFNDRVEVAAGFRVTSYDGIPMLTAPEWVVDTDIVAFRKADAKLLVHQDITFEELAKTRDSIDFMLKAYLGFALEGRPVHLTGFDLL